MAPTADFETTLAQAPLDSQQETPSNQGSLRTGVKFNPAKHLAYSPPAAILRMTDIGLEPTVLSPVATTDPFPLLSHEGVLQHRRDLFSKDVLDNCMHQTRAGSVQLRGMAPRYSPFIYEFWHSPEVLKIVSDIAGVELIPAMDYEICHTNIQIGPGGLDEARRTPVVPPEATEESIRRLEQDGGRKQDQGSKPQEIDEDKAIIEWHYDSHPWVCVVMLSDARYMSGGETELLKGDGTSMKVIAPQMGGAVLLQGRYIKHTAIPVENMPERVTIVTSFRPKDPLLIDDTTNANVRDKSHLTELYYQWTIYRLEVIAQRAWSAAKAVKERYEKNVAESDSEGKGGLCRVETVRIEEIVKWSEDMIKYIQDTTKEMGVTV